MGKKSAPAAPKPPDPTEIARAEAEFNRIDQYTPDGNVVYSGPNRNVATLSLSDDMQNIHDMNVQSDQNMLGMALERQGNLNPDPIDLSQFGDIQTGLDMSKINFEGLDPQILQQLQGLTAPQLQNMGAGPGMQQQLNTEGLPGIPTDMEGYRGDVEQAFFDRQRALMDPVLADQQRSMQNRLANRGLPDSGEAVNRDTTRFLDARNRAFTDLSRNAVLAAGQEASRQLGDTLAARGQGFGEQLAGGQFANQGAQQEFANQGAQLGFNNDAQMQQLAAQSGMRNQQFGEQTQVNAMNNQASAQNQALQQQLLNNQNQGRAQSLTEQNMIRTNQFNELASLLGLDQTQAAKLGDFYAPANANVLGGYQLNQDAQNFAYGQQMQNQNSALGGLMGLGGSIIGGPVGGAIGKGIGGMFGGGGGGGGNTPSVKGSDRRLKRNIKRIGEKLGYPWYSFEYIWGEQSEGIMSDEIPQEYVFKTASGYDVVNYDALFGV